MTLKFRSTDELPANLPDEVLAFIKLHNFDMVILDDYGKFMSVEIWKGQLLTHTKRFNCKLQGVG